MSYLLLYNKKSNPGIQPKPEKSLLSISTEPNQNLSTCSKSAMASKYQSKDQCKNQSKYQLFSKNQWGGAAIDLKINAY